MVNVEHLGHELGRRPTRREIVREFFARPRARAERSPQKAPDGATPVRLRANDGVGVEVLGDTVYAAPLPDGPIMVLEGIAALIWREATAQPRGASRMSSPRRRGRMPPPSARTSTGSSTRWSRGGCSFRSDQGGIRSEGHLRYLIDPAEGWAWTRRAYAHALSALASPSGGRERGGGCCWPRARPSACICCWTGASRTGSRRRPRSARSSSAPCSPAARRWRSRSWRCPRSSSSSVSDSAGET